MVGLEIRTRTANENYLSLDVQANSASGMAIDDECKLKFLELKAKRNYRYLTFKIVDHQVMVDKLGGPDESYEAFTSSLPSDECRYAVFDFDFTTNENCQKSKIFFIAWYACNFSIIKLNFSTNINLQRTGFYFDLYNLFYVIDRRDFQVAGYGNGEDEDGVCELEGQIQERVGWDSI